MLSLRRPEFESLSCRFIIVVFGSFLPMIPPYFAAGGYWKAQVGRDPRLHSLSGTKYYALPRIEVPSVESKGESLGNP